MDNSNQEKKPHGQVNPGQPGEEVTIKKSEGISDQGNEWSDEEGVHTNNQGVLGEKAEKYIKDSGNIEDLPDEEDERKASKELDNKEKNAQVADNQPEEDEVVESKEDYVPGYDLGRNKVQ